MTVSDRPVVVHASSVHPALDNRIHWRQCGSLAKAGFDVRHVILGDKPERGAEGVTIVSAGKRQQRLARMTVGAFRVLSSVVKQRAQIVHIHDPELILLVPFFKLFGLKVVVDLHEDPTLQIMHKNVPAGLTRVLLPLMRLGLAASRPFVDLFVTAWTHPRLPDKPDKVIEVHNYPGELEFQSDEAPAYASRDRLAVSIGSNHKERCFIEMTEAARLLKGSVELKIVGPLFPESLKDEYANEIEEAGVNLTGRKEHQDVEKILNSARVGLCLLYPTPQYKLAEPTKLFEYLSVGLPVVGADMGPTAEVLRRHDCGILVDPKDPKAIAEAIQRICDDESLADTFSKNALQAAASYTWERQVEGLVVAYHRILS